VKPGNKKPRNKDPIAIGLENRGKSRNLM